MDKKSFVINEQSITSNSVALSSNALIHEIIKYAKYQGVDFEVACSMLSMMHNDGVHLEINCDLSNNEVKL